MSTTDVRTARAGFERLRAIEREVLTPSLARRLERKLRARPGR